MVFLQDLLDYSWFQEEINFQKCLSLTDSSNMILWMDNMGMVFHFPIHIRSMQSKFLIRLKNIINTVNHSCLAVSLTHYDVICVCGS